MNVPAIALKEKTHHRGPIDDSTPEKDGHQKHSIDDHERRAGSTGLLEEPRKIVRDRSAVEPHGSVERVGLTSECLGKALKVPRGGIGSRSRTGRDDMSRCKRTSRRPLQAI
jgi:hypothetical protein